MSGVTLFSPAKLNLFLAVTGRRPDGFHDLVSLVAPLDFGDWLSASPSSDGSTSLVCDDASLPRDETNLVLRAAREFRDLTGWKGGVSFHLRKRIPVGAGLGGGSSNAVAALRVLDQLAGTRLAERDLAALAARLGSDCPLFLAGAPVIMRGRGERIEVLAASEVARLRGRRVWVFKPGFGVATPWAYARLAAGAPATYFPETEAEAWIRRWRDDPAGPLENLLFNGFEPTVFHKFVPLAALVEQMRAEFGWTVRMSGSGSACFGIVPENWSAERREAARAALREAWGDQAFFTEAALA